jgi:hypothetical protein
MARLDSPGDLAVADILLYRSNTLIGRAIRLLDDAEVSHAGLLVSTSVVGEALMQGGLQRQPLATSIAGCEWVAVRRLANVPPTMDPVLAKANEYLNHGERYAYGQIFLLAGICLLRRVDVSNPLMRRLAQAAIDKAAEFVRWCQSNGKQPMICSEFVYRSYDEAVSGDHNPYALEIQEFRVAELRRKLLGWRRRERAAAGAPPIPPESLLGMLEAEHGGLAAAVGKTPALVATARPLFTDEQLDALIEVCLSEPSEGSPKAAAGAWEAQPDVTMSDLRRSVANFAAALHETTAGGAKLGSGAYGVVPAWPAPTQAADTLAAFSADFVTPGDLFRSQSLVTVGELQP